MARMHYSEDSDSDLPDLDEIISKHVKGLRVSHTPKLETCKTTDTKMSRRKTSEKSSKSQLIEVKALKPSRTTRARPRSETEPHTTAENKREELGRPCQDGRALEKQKEANVPKSLEASTDTTTRRRRRLVSYREARTKNATRGSEDEAKEPDIEESIWGESDEDPILDKGKVFQSSRKVEPSISKSHEPTFALSDMTEKLLELELDGLSDKENGDRALLRFSPPRSARPVLDRPSTPPPASPTKSRLVSPSKKKNSIPIHPDVSHIDAFWDVHEVNSWNDQYSPQKPLASPQKNRNIQRDDSDSPLPSPVKNQSPSKRSRAVIDARRDFESRKQRLAADFLEELDIKITDGKIKEMASHAGGVKIIWSKTLNTTAGRANWKRETVTIRNLDGTTTTTKKHHAFIELAEKVIDDEERLLNVVAHEFCHLANFMVSGIKDQPHGHQFKVWGRKCSAAFGHRGVEVTTKHSYKIDYKYIWTCTNELCGCEFKRHSKSIDPARQICSACRGKLVQTKPAPRKQAGPTGYAAFVKENFASLKQEMTGATHKEVMSALGQRYREQKAVANTADSKNDIVDVAKAFEVVTLDSD